MKTIRLRDGKERSLLRRHPWVFEGSIGSGKADAGETVRVEGADGRFLAWGAYSPQSQIRVRAWSFDEAERIDAAFFAAPARARRGAARAACRRQRCACAWCTARPTACPAWSSTVTATRCARSSWPPASSAGRPRSPTRCCRYRLHAALRTQRRQRARARRPGAAQRLAARRGRPTEVDDPRARLALTLDVAEGHKTGYYLDQRDNRRAFADAVRQYGCAARAELLQLHRRLHAWRRWPVARRRSSASTRRRRRWSGAEAHVALNGFEPRAMIAGCRRERHLREHLDAGRRFDAIVLDPPKFAPTAAHAERAARAYKDINRLALHAADAGRAAAHVLLLRRHPRRPLPQDRRRRRARCRRRRAFFARLGRRPTTR